MLICFSNYTPFEVARTERLICLEKHLRRRSDSRVSLKDYRDWLDAAYIPRPSDRSLSEDLRRYTAYCDDVDYGEKAASKALTLNPTASDHAVAYFLGHSWLNAPLRPNISSSRARCFLLAMTQQAEVDFPYAALREPGESWKGETRMGIPLCVIPGADSGYIQLRMAWGGRMNINLARVQGDVCFTGNTAADYVPLQDEKEVRFRVQSQDPHLLERLQHEFPNFSMEDSQTLLLKAPQSLALMTNNLLTAYLSRTRQKDRTIPPVQTFTHAILHFEED